MAIDGNTRGLRKQQEKFYSLVLSPSAEELKHLKNDPDKLRAYTQQVMNKYAENFNLSEKEVSRGTLLSSSDLIWYATIHQERKEKEGEQKGISKAGLHQHVHIIVSAQDKTGELRLNPRGRGLAFLSETGKCRTARAFSKCSATKSRLYPKSSPKGCLPSNKSATNNAFGTE